MPRTSPRRITHRYDGELIVFLIGMKINKPWRPDAWFPVFMAMIPMIKELATNKDSGLLGYRLTLESHGPTVIQYWNSLDKLYAYASDSEAKHRPAWRAYNRMVRRSAGAVGVWHETYEVARAESIYVEMPAIGLARSTEEQPVGAGMNHARERI